MVWNVISIMNPHRYMWLANSMPVAAATVAAIFLGLIVSRDQRHLPFRAPTAILLLFAAWICLVYPFSVHVESSWEQLIKVLKIQLMIFVTLLVLRERRHLEWLVWVLVVSVGYYGIKGGIFTLLHGAEYRVWGPPGTFIEDNNELALALIMTIPLMRYLQLQMRNKWVRLAFYSVMIACLLSALGSHSRGALLAMSVMAFMLWLRGSKKLVWAPIFLLAGAALIAFMPEHWGDRMETIATYEQDASAMGRINAWWTAFHIAQDRMFGGGFDIYRADVFAIYAPDPDDIHAAHSIYFQVLGELGFVGLAIFLSFWFFTWCTASWVRRHARSDPEIEWAATLASLSQVSLVAYLVGGAFYSLSYFDLPYNLMVLVVIARQIVKDRLRVRQTEPATMVGLPQVASAPPANSA